MNAAAISDVRIDVATEEQPTAINTSLVPNVIGLTESAARKRLSHHQQEIKVVYQVFKNKVIGQAVKQIPAAGEQLEETQVVTVIFAKQEGTFN